MHIIDHEKWTDDVFRQAVKFKIVVCHSPRNKREAFNTDFLKALTVAIFAKRIKKPVLLYAVTDYQTVLLPVQDWEHFRQIWENRTHVGIFE